MSDSTERAPDANESSKSGAENLPVAEGTRSNDEPWAVYLAKRLVGEKSFQLGVPEEAAGLAEGSDIVLSYGDLSLNLACIVDREGNPEKRFSLEQKELLEIGSACLKYTGTMNGAKMPVGISLYEVGDRPASPEDIERFKALQKSMPGSSKVLVTCFYLDTKNKTVFCSALFNGLFRGRKWLESMLAEPRKRHEDIFVPEALLPSDEGRPVATIGVLVALASMFVVEQLADAGRQAHGLLGVNVGTLFALGGMNRDAVLTNGEWHRLLSAALLHGDAFHILLNGFALGMAGLVLEPLLGRAWFLSLFFIGALGGSLMGLLVNPANIVSVGASGAVMALLAAAVVVAMRFPRGAQRTQIQVSMLQFLIPSLIPLASHRQQGHIDFAAHFGGAIAGVAAGFALMKIWPRTQERPRFRSAALALAAASLVGFALSLFLTKQHYPEYAAAATFASKELLVDDDAIPKDFAAAKQQVETWGKDRPRDPRVHLYRAFRLFDEEQLAGAEKELRAALSEREILERAFSNGKLEASIRSVLCQLLVQQGRTDEARREAQPVCKGSDPKLAEPLKSLGLCE
ncbi:MAG TPA: rhomboid family intramembrane serine protease [Polyangiaceae bacterium]|nr:rhomboid family intramembrane serine protease [Polyangiaceae bacterium]